MASVNRILAVLALGWALSALPMPAMAQQDVPHVLLGTATLNGFMPPQGTPIVAKEGNNRLGSAMTRSGGKYTLQVARPSRGGVITFLVGGVEASERLANWELGKIQSSFTLTAMASLSPQQEPPHVVLGRATLFGEIPPAATEILAMWGNTRLGSALTRAGGEFTLQISRPPGNGAITFVVDGAIASERLEDWEFGKVQSGFNLTTRKISPAEALGPLIDSRNLVTVWHFDNNAKVWFFYVPTLGEDSTLATIKSQEIYLVRVVRSANVVLNGTARNLTCMDGNCWNHIVW